MLMINKRTLKPYAKNETIKTEPLFSADSPSWISWLYWFYPLFNASIFTPAVVLTAETASIGTYFLIFVNACLLVWNLKQTITNIIYDTDNRKRHILELAVISVGIGVGIYIAFLTVPFLSPISAPIFFIFTIINFSSSLANLMVTVSRLSVPWLHEKWRVISCKVNGEKLKPITMPDVIEEECNKTNEFYLTHYQMDSMDDKLKSKEINIERNDSYDSRLLFRLKALNLCYTYKERKIRVFGGAFRHANTIKTCRQHALAIMETAAIPPGSGRFVFYASRVDMHIRKIAYDMHRYIKIRDAKPKSADRESIMKFLGVVDVHAVIDHLTRALTAIEQFPAVDVSAILRKHIRFSDGNNSLQQQIDEIENIVYQLLNERMLSKLLKLHDEEALSKPEIVTMLTQAMSKLEIKDCNKVVEDVCSMLGDVLSKRQDAQISPCPTAAHPPCI